MADGYRVNTDELEAVVKRLQAIQQNMARTAERSSTGTAVEAADFGQGFSHATALYQAHDRVQLWLNDTINGLNGLIDEFGTNTHTVNTAYRNQESENVATMAKYQQELD